MFDSWAGNLAPADYDVFALPYQKRVVEQIKKAHPDVPLISYIAKSAALLERMRDNGCDIVSVDWTVTMSDARARLGPDVGVQGNLESAVLLSNRVLFEGLVRSAHLRTPGDIDFATLNFKSRGEPV